MMSLAKSSCRVVQITLNCRCSPTHDENDDDGQREEEEEKEWEEEATLNNTQRYMAV